MKSVHCAFLEKFPHRPIVLKWSIFYIWHWKLSEPVNEWHRLSGGEFQKRHRVKLNKCNSWLRRTWSSRHSLTDTQVRWESLQHRRRNRCRMSRTAPGCMMSNVLLWTGNFTLLRWMTANPRGPRTRWMRRASYLAYRSTWAIFHDSFSYRMRLSMHTGILDFANFHFDRSRAFRVMFLLCILLDDLTACVSGKPPGGKLSAVAGHHSFFRAVRSWSLRLSELMDSDLAWVNGKSGR